MSTKPLPPYSIEQTTNDFGAYIVLTVRGETREMAMIDDERVVSAIPNPSHHVNRCLRAEGYEPISCL